MVCLVLGLGSVPVLGVLCFGFVGCLCFVGCCIFIFGCWFVLVLRWVGFVCDGLVVKCLFTWFLLRCVKCWWFGGGFDLGFWLGLIGFVMLVGYGWV